eukprot:334888-Chlamydomonas_euryale.AAC.2
MPAAQMRRRQRLRVGGVRAGGRPGVARQLRRRLASARHVGRRVDGNQAQLACAGVAQQRGLGTQRVLEDREATHRGAAQVVAAHKRSGASGAAGARVQAGQSALGLKRWLTAGTTAHGLHLWGAARPHEHRVQDGARHGLGLRRHRFAPR